MAGSKWPQGDEDGLWRIAEHWHESASEMSDLIPDLDRVRNETMSVITGQTADTAAQEFAKLFDGEYSVDKLVEAMSALGETARQAGTQVEASKIEILVGLALAAAEILYAIAMAPWTFGASMAWIPPIEALTMAAIRALFNQLLRALVRQAVEALTKTTVSRLLREVAQQSAEEVAEELIVNLAIQQYQVDQGHKDNIDWDDVGTAAKGAAAGGAAAGLIHGPTFGALGGKHGEGGIGNALAGFGAAYTAEVGAGVVGAMAVGGNLDAGEIFAGGALGGIAGGIDSSHGGGHDSPNGTPGGLGGDSHAFDPDTKNFDAKDPDGESSGGKSDENRANGPDGDTNDPPPPSEEHQSNGSPDVPKSLLSQDTDNSNTAATGAPQPQNQGGQNGSQHSPTGDQSNNGVSQSDSGAEQNNQNSSKQSPGGGQSNSAGGQTDPGDGQNNHNNSQQSPGGGHSNNSADQSDSSTGQNGQNSQNSSQHSPTSDQSNNGASQTDPGDGQNSQSGSQHASGGGNGDHGGSPQTTGDGNTNQTVNQHDSVDGQSAQQQSSSGQPAPQEISGNNESHTGEHHPDGSETNSSSTHHDSQSNHTSDHGPEPTPHQTTTTTDTPPAHTDTPPPVSQSPASSPTESPTTDHESATQPAPPPNQAPPADPQVHDGEPTSDGPHQLDRPPSDQPSHVGTSPSDTNDNSTGQPPSSPTEPSAGNPALPANTSTTPPPATASPSTVATPPPTPANTPATGPTSGAGTQPATTPSPSNPSSSPTAPTNSPTAPSTQTGPTTTPPSNTAAGPVHPGAPAKPASAGLSTSSNSTPTAVSNIASTTAAAPASRSTTQDQSEVVVGMVSPPPPPPTGTSPKPRPKVTSGGPPPRQRRPQRDSHTDVASDETWRHDPATTADWFEPRNPVPLNDIDNHRDETFVQTVDTEVANVLTDSTPTRMPAPHTNLIRYDLRRIEVAPNKFVQEYTVRLSVTSDNDPAIGPDTVTDIQAKVKAGVDSLLNNGNRLPSGDEFRVNVEFTDTGPHAEVKVGNFAENTQTTWRPDATENVLAHEILHYLGVPDEGRDSRIALRRHAQNSGVHGSDGGMMGPDILGHDPRLRPRHLWTVERTANSQIPVLTFLLTTADNARAPLPPKVFNVDDQPNETSRAPKRGRSSPSPEPNSPSTAPPKRPRVDNQDHSERSGDDDVSDIDMDADTRLETVEEDARQRDVDPHPQGAPHSDAEPESDNEDEFFDAPTGLEVDEQDSPATPPAVEPESDSEDEFFDALTGLEGNEQAPSTTEQTPPTQTPPTTEQTPPTNPQLPARSGPDLVLGGMDVVERFDSGNESLDQVRRLVTEHGGQKTWDDNRERLTALFSDDGLKPKVPGMLRGGKPVSQVVELGFGRTLSLDLRLDGSPDASSLRFKENVGEYEFEHSSDPSSVIGSFDEGRRTYVAGAQAGLTHPNASHTMGLFGVREHQWSDSTQRTDRQISGGQTTEPGTRFEGDIRAVVAYRLSGPVNLGTGSGRNGSLPPVSFHTEVTVPTRAVTDGAGPAAASDGPPRVTNSRALTGSDVVTNLQLLPDAVGPHRGPQSTTEFVTSPPMRTAFESAYGKRGDRAMNEVDDWMSVELLQANLHGMTNKQPLVRHLEGIPGGRVEVHAFVESLGTPPNTTPAFGEQTSNSENPRMRATGETSKTEFHYGTETDSATTRQDQITYTAQLPLPGRTRGQGGPPTGEVVGGLDGGLNVGRSTNEVTGSQFRNRSTLKNPVAGQSWNGQVRLRFVMHGPGSVSPTQPNGAFKGAVHETRAEFDALIEKSETTPTTDYRDTQVHAPPARIWGRSGPSAEHNSSTRRSRWKLGSTSRPVATPGDGAAPTPRERGEREPLAGLGSMDRVTNLDLSGFHGLVDSMGHRAFGRKWNEVRPTVTAAAHLNRIRAGLPGMTQHSPLTSTELAGPGSSSTLALTADIENLTYRRTIDKVLSSPSMESTEGSTTTTVSTKQIAGQAALGGRGGDVAGAPVLGEAIAGANQTTREGNRVREQQRTVVQTKFEQPMAIFDGWVRIDGTMTGPKATVHESGLFPVEIAIPLTELQGSRTHDAVLPPTFDRSNPAGFVEAPPAVPESTPAATTSTLTQPTPHSDADVAARRQQISGTAFTNKPGSSKGPWWSTSQARTTSAPPPRTSNDPPLDDIADRAPEANPADGGWPRRAPEATPLTWTPPTPTTEPPAPPAHALQESWHPTDMLVGLDPASGLAEAIRADLGPALGKDVDKAMQGVTQQFGPQVLQARLVHQSGQQWSHDIAVTGGKITVKVKAIREAGAEYVGQSAKFETDLSIESQSSTARLQDDLTRHVEGGRLVVPFPHGSASAQVTHSGSILPKSAPAASGDLTTPRAETTVTDTDHRVPTRVRTTEANDLFRQPIRFEISYEKHKGARLLSKVPENAADVRLAGVFSYPHTAPADNSQAGREPSAPADGPGIRLEPDHVVTEVRPPAPQQSEPQQAAPAATRTPTEDAVAAHVLDSMTEPGREVFGDDWPAVRAELAQHVGTRALHGGLGDYSRNGEKTVELDSVRGGKVVLSARVDDLTAPAPGTARDAEFYTGGQTIQTTTDTNTKIDNWAVTLQAQGTVLPVDVGVNASLLGRVDINRAADSSNTRTKNSATGELFRKKAAANIQAGTATVRAQMSCPAGLFGHGSRRESDGAAKIDFRARQSSPDAEQQRYEPRPETHDGGQRGLPQGAIVRKVVDGDQFRHRTQDNLEAVSGIVASRLRDQLPPALSDVTLQRHLPAMTRGEEVELFRDGSLRVTGHADLTALNNTGAESNGGMRNLLNEVNQGYSHQDSSAWETGPRFMAGPHGNLGDVLRGNIMFGGGALGRSRHGASHGQNAKVSANAKFAGSHGVFDGAATIVLTVHDGDSSHPLAGVDVHGPMLIPTSRLDQAETPPAPADLHTPPPQPNVTPPPPPPSELPVVSTGTTGARLSTSSTGPAGQPAGSPIVRRHRLQRLFGGGRGPTVTPANGADTAAEDVRPASPGAPAPMIELTDFGAGLSLQGALDDSFARFGEHDGPRRPDAP
ncbi:WXG100-like domain-containing protein [Mycobacterium sp. NPDC003449]